MSADLQTDTYNAFYDLVMAALNPGYDPLTTPLPPIPIIQDQQDQAGPVAGKYIAIQGSPSLSPIGTISRVSIVPIPPVLPATVSTLATQTLVQPYQGTCKIWEVNGNGSSLQRIRLYAETEAAKNALDLTSVSLLQMGDVIEASYKAESHWVAQSVMMADYTIASVTTEILPLTNTIAYTGP